MAGILLYTAAPDSEGTLGGLVSLGEPKSLGRHLDQALEQMKLCTSDPLCAERHPHRDSMTLHGAACHACLFLPETSCERGNKYLDRSLLVATVETSDLAFFTEFSEAIPADSVSVKTDEAANQRTPVAPALSEPDEIVDLCDARCEEFVRSWIKRGLPLPRIAFDLRDDKSRNLAQAELAWPNKKIAAVLPEGGDNRNVFEQHGWHVFDALTLAADEQKLRELLGA